MKTFAKILRVVAIVLLSLTAAITLISGVGTTCVAFGAENYDSMAALVPYKGVYQAFVFLTSAVAVALIVATVAFARGRRWAYPGSLIILLIGAVIGIIHTSLSASLRGSGAPANVRVYASLLTLGMLLILRLPAIWQWLDHGEDDPDIFARPAAGTAMIVAGVAMLIAPLWATPTHILDGINWAHAFDLPLLASGSLLMLGGVVLLRKARAIRVSVVTETPQSILAD